MDYKNKKFKVAFTYRKNEVNTAYIDILYNGLISNGVDENDIFLDYKDPHRLRLNSKSLPYFIPYIYQNSKVVVVCISSGYDQSKWCGLEFKSVLNILLDDENETFLIKLDDSTLPIHFKNHNFTEKGSVVDTDIINEILRRSSNDLLKISENDVAVYNCTYNLREKEYYKILSKKIKEYYKSKNNDSDPPTFYERTKLFEKIKNKIDDKGFVFIEGPLLTGKTSLFKCFSKWIKDSIEENIIIDSLTKDKMKIHPINGIRDRVDLYQLWGKSILEHLFDNGYLDKSKLKGINLSIYDHSDVFKDHLREIFDKSPASTTFFQIFLFIIDDFNRRYSKDKRVLYLAIHLDDFQSYVNEKVYDELEKDIDSLVQSNCLCEELEGIKLMISTRLFRKRRPYNIVVYINNFNEYEIEIYLKKYIEVIDDSCMRDLIVLIVEYTSGHPWFVDRFLHLYLVLRANDRESNPISLANKLFNNRSYWLSNAIFESSTISCFKRKLEGIVDSSNIDENIINFLEIKSFDPDKFSEYKNHPKLKETGLIRISLTEESEEDIKGFGNKIMQLYFHNEILKYSKK